jgi:glycosyltransferase involved in cell wall biosynthesis
MYDRSPLERSLPRPVLLLLSQLPHDPTSGAAISMLATAKLLAAAGFPVRALSTSASESPGGVPLLPLLAQRGIRPEIDRRSAVGKGRPVVRFVDGGAHFTVLDTGALGVRDWDFPHGQHFQRLLLHELEAFQPEVVFTFGGMPTEQARRHVCRAAGAAVVFCLKNLSYNHPLAFEAVDAVLTPSEFMTRHYRDAIGLESTAIPPPMDLAEVLSPKREPKYFTYVNPTPAKGVYFFVTLAAELARRRPDIPLQVIESRGKGEHVIQAGAHGQIDLRRHPNLRFVATRAMPREVYADARAMLIPSVWQEPFGRVAIEAMLNGVPPLVSGRGGLKEAVGVGGFVLPLPESVNAETTRPVDRGAVEAWVNTIERLHDDAAFYEAASGKARAASQVVSPQLVAARYVEFFETVQPRTRPVVAAAR